MANWILQPILSTGGAAARAAALDGSGNNIVAGSFQGTSSWGGTSVSSSDSVAAFIGSADGNGLPSWMIALVPQGADSWAESSAVAVDGAGSTFAAGVFLGTATLDGQTISSLGAQAIWVAKLDASGALLWIQSFSPPKGAVAVWNMAMGPAGNVALIGSHDGGTDFGGGPVGVAGRRGTFLVVLGADGDYVWAADYGDGQWPVAIAFAPTGDLVMAGSFGDTLTFGSVSLVNAGLSRGCPDVFVARLSASGQHLWSRRGGGGQTQALSALALDPTTSDIFVAGWFASMLDLGGLALSGRGTRAAFVAKLDESGNPLWGRAWGDSEAYATALAAVPGGDVVLGGSFVGRMDVGTVLIAPGEQRCLWAARLNSLGGVVWAKQSPTEGMSGLAAVCVASPGEVRLSGCFAGTATVDGLVAHAERPSFFVARIQG